MKSMVIATAFPMQKIRISGIGENAPIPNASTFVIVVIVTDGPVKKKIKNSYSNLFQLN